MGSNKQSWGSCVVQQFQYFIVELFQIRNKIIHKQDVYWLKLHKFIYFLLFY